MAGKSTQLKTIGQLFYLTAHAIPIPCAEARLPLVDFISFGCDSETNQRTDLSSFASELISVNQALKREGFGLFLLDEFARGTNPKEGEAFARATVESFAEKDGLTVSATHFTAPTLVEQAGHFRIRGLSNDNYEKLKMILNPSLQSEISALTNRVQELHKYMDYSLEEVSEDKEPPKAALMIADILGIEPNILEKVKKYLEED
jgi:dsDNA-specific endonuclease/ATPase MutS2